MFCREKNKYKYCVNKNPKMSAKKIVKNFFLFLLSKKFNDAYKLLSIEKKGEIGSLSNFIKYITDTDLKHIIQCKSWLFYSQKKKDPCDIEYSAKINIISKNNLKYTYNLKLSRQYDWINNKPICDKYTNENLYLYWRIDNIKYENKTIENFISVNKNINNTDLELCSNTPPTGFYRDGYCKTGENDFGTHTVCAEVTNDFLKSQKKLGNDLINPNLTNDFPGLKNGDYWCLCVNRYKQAKDKGLNLKVKRNATHINTKNYILI